MAATTAIRPAQRSDRAEIVAIYNHYIASTAATFEVEPVTVDGKADWFAGHSSSGPHQLWVATDPEDRVRGWASSSPFRPRAAYSTTVESSVYCRADSRGIGVGSGLYSTLLGALRAHDVERVVAGVALPNPGSVALHRRFGFRWVGTFTRVGRKFGRYWDVAWFERAARPPPDELRESLASVPRAARRAAGALRPHRRQLEAPLGTPRPTRSTARGPEL